MSPLEFMPAQAVGPAECEANCAHHRAVRLTWAKLLKQVFDLDLQHCPNCGGDLRIIAAILEPPGIEKILTHLVMSPLEFMPAQAVGPAECEANCASRPGRRPVARRCKGPEATQP